MLAIDQGEPLRAMLARGAKPGNAGSDAVAEISDEALVHFKSRVVRILSPLASAVLLDQRYSWDFVVTGGVIAEGCAPMISADRFVPAGGDPVSTTEIDPDVDLPTVAEQGARAAKLLIIWREDEPVAGRVAMGRTFVEACARAGLASIVEVVCKSPRRGSTWDWGPGAVVAAARELGGLGADLYEAQVPLKGVGGDEALIEACRAVHAAVECPWVLLSSDVAPADFARALRLACLAGASGFLAGRVVWSSSIGAGDLDAALKADAVPRLRELVTIVDEAMRDRNHKGGAA